MCHSVEMYMPQMARAAAEQRFHAAGRVSVLAGLRGLLKLEKVSDALKNNKLKLEHGLWLSKSDDPAGRELVTPGGGT